jgi:hypothetical protein
MNKIAKKAIRFIGHPPACAIAIIDGPIAIQKGEEA